MDINKLPPNPLYAFEYAMPVSMGNAKLSIPAAGGKITQKDCEVMRKWFDLISEQLLDSVELIQESAPAENDGR